jgi:hypothetical protein
MRSKEASLEFSRFRDLAKKLVAVPRHELEAKMREYDAAKAQRRAARKKKPA